MDVSCGTLPWRCAGFRELSAFECLDDDHQATAFRAYLVLLVGVGTLIVIGFKISVRLQLDTKQSPDHLDPVATNAVSKEACMADTVEAGG